MTTHGGPHRHAAGASRAALSPRAAATLAAASLLAVGALSACAPPATSPAAPPVATSSPAPTASPAPTSSATPTATPAPSTTTWPAAISGFDAPTNIEAPDDGSGRLFVTDQAGVIRVIRDGRLEKTPALDITSRVHYGGEQGLIGLAFPPGFAAKRYAYVYFTDRSGHASIWRVRMRTDGTDRFDPATLQLILRVAEPYANHQGGQLAFGPDGYLYIALGDGGSERDPGNRGQNRSILLAKILRIDVESTPHSTGYRVPADNPFVHRPGSRPETWEWGLRNPWRFSFDPKNGDLWIGDVGQDSWEEVDLVPGDARGGEDFGWSLYEGDHLFKAKTKRAGFTWPVAEYSHSEGDAIVGGYVYRGAAHPAEQGLYVFGDYGTGRIWTLRRSGSAWVRHPARDTGYQIGTFGADGSGELWVADRSTGTIHRLGDLTK